MVMPDEEVGLIPSGLDIPSSKESFYWVGASQMALMTEPACQCRRCEREWVRSPGWEDPLEEGLAVHSSILAWRIPWSLVGYSPRDHQESGLIERLTLSPSSPKR